MTASTDNPTQARKKGMRSIRHLFPRVGSSRLAPATIRATDPARAEIVFDDPQIAITQGQAVVFYDGDIVLGGGWIQ